MKTKTEFYQSYFEILQKKGFTVAALHFAGLCGGHLPQG